jgi:DNA excision repair protein ERCC-2
MGCQESTMDMLLSSPFPRENCLVTVFDRISTLYKRRWETREQLAETLTSLVRQKRGNYMFFFPSYQYLNMVMVLFKSMNAGIRTLIQQPDMKESEREKFIETFKTEKSDTLVGFAQSWAGFLQRESTWWVTAFQRQPLSAWGSP